MINLISCLIFSIVGTIIAFFVACSNNKKPKRIGGLITFAMSLYAWIDYVNFDIPKTLVGLLGMIFAFIMLIVSMYNLGLFRLIFHHARSHSHGDKHHSNN